MLWSRALLFSFLMPGSVAFLVPATLTGFSAPLDDWWQLGWILVIFGLALYIRCLRSFVVAKGTPAIFFTWHLRSVIGAEPPVLVRSDVYRLSRNPMYLAVVCMVVGQAIAFASTSVALYALILFVVFHLVVTLVEEPHLRARDRAAFQRYCERVPRWIGLPLSKKRP
jgi:protein-S-isoprenylcysteine O-methyltransferase Ste14